MGLRAGPPSSGSVVWGNLEPGDKAGLMDADDQKLTSPEPEDNLPAYALDILDDDEAEEVSQQTATSAELQDELRRDEATVGMLGYVVQQHEPPPELKRRVLATSIETRNLPINLAERRKSDLSRTIAAIAAVFVVILFGASIGLWYEVEDRDNQIADLRATAEEGEERVETLRETAESAGVWVNFEQPFVWTPLNVTQPEEDAGGYLCRSQDGTVGYVITTGMDVEEGKVLQAWLIGEEGRWPSGTFSTDTNGRGFLILQRLPDEPVQAFTTIAITMEPPGGSLEPTTDPVLIAEID